MVIERYLRPSVPDLGYTSMLVLVYLLQIVEVSPSEELSEPLTRSAQDLWWAAGADCHYVFGGR